jgi:putative transcriptional regulator
LANHVSQAVFAAIMGIGNTTVHQWEQGQKTQAAQRNAFSTSLIERACP